MIFRRNSNENMCYFSTSIDENISCSPDDMFDEYGFSLHECENYPCKKMESDIKKYNIKEEIKNNSIRVNMFDIEKGGIYLETTDDSRGWILGDKTRRIYKATIAQVALLTNLLITISPHWNGIKVKVHNPNEVSRMLVSINDDVGSSIEYAKYDGSRPLELSAEIGQHVCIESMTNGSWVRVQVFPGEYIEKYY